MRYIALFLLAASLISSIHAEVVSGCTPSQIHLSLGDNYYTSKELTDLVLPSSNLNYNQAYLVFHTSEICNFTLNITNGTNSSQLISYQNVTLQNNFNYTFKTDANTNVTYKSVAYTALIQNLTYGTLYTYNIQDFQNKSLTNPVNFTLANPRISNTTYTSGNLTNKTISNKIVLIGNLDKNARGSTTLNRVANNVKNATGTYAGVIQLGNIAYNLESNNGATGDSFFDAIQTLASSTPLVIASGSNVSFANYSFFDLRVRNPLFDQTHNRYFSYNLQGIHFVSIDFDYYENSTQDVQSKMLAWVKADLETANNTAHRAIYPFIVIVSSQSIYCADNSTCAGLYSKRKAWDELFYNSKVNLVISATSSAYQRLGQIYQNASLAPSNSTNEISSQKAPLYINEGIGGDSNLTQYNASGYAQALAFNPGYGELYLLNSTDDIRLIYNHYDSQNGTIVDSLQLIKTWKTNSNSIFGELSAVGSIMKIIFGIIIICAAIKGYRIYKKRKEDPERVRLTNVKEMNPSRIYGGKHATNISMVDLVL